MFHLSNQKPWNESAVKQDVTVHVNICLARLDVHSRLINHSTVHHAILCVPGNVPALSLYLPPGGE